MAKETFFGHHCRFITESFLTNLLNSTLFYRSFDGDWMDDCEDIELNKGTSKRWRFSNQNSTSGRLAEIPLCGWIGYHHDFYLLNIITEPNVFQAVHGLSIS